MPDHEIDFDCDPVLARSEGSLRRPAQQAFLQGKLFFTILTNHWLKFSDGQQGIAYWIDTWRWHWTRSHSCERSRI